MSVHGDVVAGLLLAADRLAFELQAKLPPEARQRAFQHAYGDTYAAAGRLRRVCEWLIALEDEAAKAAQESKPINVPATPPAILSALRAAERPAEPAVLPVADRPVAPPAPALCGKRCQCRVCREGRRSACVLLAGHHGDCMDDGGRALFDPI